MGGEDGSRGYLVQTIIALLDSLDGFDWETVTIEPRTDEEKVDISWERQAWKRVFQVKSSKNQIGKADAENWASELAENTTADEYKLILVGPCSQSVVTMGAFKGVDIPPPKSLDPDGMIEQAAHRLEKFLIANQLSGQTAFQRELMVKALTTEFFTSVAKPFTKSDLIQKLARDLRTLTQPVIDQTPSHNVVKSPNAMVGNTIGGNLTVFQGESLNDELREIATRALNEFASTELNRLFCQQNELIDQVTSALQRVDSQGKARENLRARDAIALVRESGDISRLQSLLLKQATELEAKILTDQDDLADRFQELASISRAQGDYDDAIQLYEKAIQLQPTVLSIRCLCAGTLILSGQLDQAESRVREAYDLSEPNSRRRGDACITLGEVLRQQGNLDEAFDVTSEGVACYEDGVNEPHAAQLRGNLALIQKRRGKLKEAAELHRSAIRVLEDHDDRPAHGIELVNLGEVTAELDDLGEGSRLMREGLRNISKGGTLEEIGYAQHKIGKLAFFQGELYEAELALKGGLRAAIKCGNTNLQAFALRLLAAIYGIRGWWSDAAKLLNRRHSIEGNDFAAIKLSDMERTEWPMQIPEELECELHIMKRVRNTLEIRGQVSFEVTKDPWSNGGKGTESLREGYWGLADTFRNYGNYLKAIQNLKEVKRLWVKHGGPLADVGATETQGEIDAIETKFARILQRGYVNSMYEKPRQEL